MSKLTSYLTSIDGLYSSCPVFIQNILISLQGYIFKRERYGGGFSENFTQAVERSCWSYQQLQNYQFERLKKFLVHASETSPYWREVMTRRGFDPKAMLSIEDLTNLPILEKDDLRKNLETIKSSVCSYNKIIWSYTSGTTGTPLRVGYIVEDVRERYAILNRIFHQYDIPPMARSVRFSGRAIFPRAEKNRLFWRYNYFNNQLIMSSYHLHPEAFQDYFNKLFSYDPMVIDGYPSSIYIIARFINENGLSALVKPRLVMTTAETLEDYQREEISKAFGGCLVVNQYASSEGAPFISENSLGELIVNIDSGVFEFVKPGTNEKANPGDLAEMVLTSFTTRAFPLIRYRIGDTVLLPDHEKLSSSWKMPTVGRIMGRQEDILFTPEKGYVGRLDPVFKKVPPTIFESQIVQTAPMSIQLNVVPDYAAGYRHTDLDQVIKELRNRLGGVDIDVREFDRLPRSKNGKLRAVVGLKN